MARKKKAKGKKVLTYLRRLIVLGVLAASISFGYLQIEKNSTSHVISDGVYIENISLGGKEPKEAEKLLQDNYGQPITAQKLQVKANNKLYQLDYSKLNPKYNIEEVVQEAYSYNKKLNFLESLLSKKNNERKELGLSFTYDKSPIDELINKIKTDANKEPVNAKLSFINGEISVTPEVDGLTLKEEKLKQDITSQINGGLAKEPKVIEAVFESSKPEVTSEKLAAVNTVVASFSTSFTTSIANRINNIELATKAINGTVLMPGESFSFNKIVGERTKARGYKEAGVIIGDKIESGLGGGICQVSSTLYNAVLKANLKVEERRNHSLPLSYVGKGLDATVDWGNIDLRFMNNFDTPIYIEGYTKNKNVYLNIYADKALTNKTYEFATEVYQVVKPNVKYTEDANRNEGESVVVKKASDGYKVKVYRKIFENSKLVATELVSNDYYSPINGEIINGTKKLAAK
jgi:vancomycin resistance protein YoaR